MLTLQDRLENVITIVTTEKQKAQLKNNQWIRQKGQTSKVQCGR